MVERRIHAMHKRFGIDWKNTCKDCRHLISGEWHDRRYHKCELYGMSHSEATDWRLSWMACGAFDLDTDIDKWFPVLEELKHAVKPPDPPLPGQIDISAFLGG